MGGLLNPISVLPDLWFSPSYNHSLHLAVLLSLDEIVVSPYEGSSAITPASPNGSSSSGHAVIFLGLEAVV